MEFIEIVQHPIFISAISAGGTAGLSYLVNKKKIKADTESIVASTYQKLIHDLVEEVERINKRVIEFENKLKASELSLNEKENERQKLLQEVKLIRRRNELLMIENRELMKKNENSLAENLELMSQNNDLQSKIITLEEQIKRLMDGI